ncbi:hypothetical protein ACS0TY_021981 [Phlomoides rotata]
MMQAELFILRLSRISGVLGLAGMAFTSKNFSEFTDFSVEESKAHGILLVRPLLEFSKEDMYNICQGGNQQWVEDPTNRSPLYARNRIRMALSDLLSSVFKAELQAVVSECRKTRVHVEKLCHLMLNQTLTIMPHGYAEIDLVTLHSTEVKDIYLAKFVALVVQFISQKHRPIRGNGLKLLLNYLRTFPCKVDVVLQSCSPGSKGTKVLLCCSFDSSVPPVIKLCRTYSYSERKCYATNELEQIERNIEANLDKILPDVSRVPFLGATSSESVLIEAKRIDILSDSSHKAIVSLQKQESEKFIKSKAETISDSESQDNITYSGSKSISPGQVGFFMNRFLLDWKVCSAQGQCNCICCVTVDEMVAEVRCMVDSDWIYIYDLSKKINPENIPTLETKQLSGESMDYAILSASRALASLKSIPIAARRSMPVLVTSKGDLLSIPSIGFSCCPHLLVSADFRPWIPLGGGHSSFA